MPIDELVARHEEEMAQMVDSVTKSAAAGAASATIINAYKFAPASANGDASSVDTDDCRGMERDRADAVVAPDPITPQGVHCLRPVRTGCS